MSHRGFSSSTFGLNEWVLNLIIILLGKSLLVKQHQVRCIVYFAAYFLFLNFSRTRLVSVAGSAKPCYGCGVPGDRSYHRGFAKNPIVAWCSAVS